MKDQNPMDKLNDLIKMKKYYTEIEMEGLRKVESDEGDTILVQVDDIYNGNIAETDDFYRGKRVYKLYFIIK